MVRDKRLVMAHTSGARAGLKEVFGTLAELSAHTGLTGTPFRFPDVDFGDHVADCELVRQGETYVLYREVDKAVTADDDGA